MDTHLSYWETGQYNRDNLGKGIDFSTDKFFGKLNRGTSDENLSSEGNVR